jgi:hypothetical protein
VPRSATRRPPALTTLPLTFATGDAPTLRAGQRIKVWLSSSACPSVVLLPDVTVQSVRTLDSGFGAHDGQNIVISVAPEVASRVIAAQAFEDARVRAGILSGAQPADDAGLPDITDCAGTTDR